MNPRPDIADHYSRLGFTTMRPSARGADRRPDSGVLTAPMFVRTSTRFGEVRSHHCAVPLARVRQFLIAGLFHSARKTFGNY